MAVTFGTRLGAAASVLNCMFNGEAETLEEFGDFISSIGKLRGDIFGPNGPYANLGLAFEAQSMLSDSTMFFRDIRDITKGKFFIAQKNLLDRLNQFKRYSFFAVGALSVFAGAQKLKITDLGVQLVAMTGLVDRLGSLPLIGSAGAFIAEKASSLSLETLIFSSLGVGHFLTCLTSIYKEWDHRSYSKQKDYAEKAQSLKALEAKLARGQEYKNKMEAFKQVWSSAAKLKELLQKAGVKDLPGNKANDAPKPLPDDLEELRDIFNTETIVNFSNGKREKFSWEATLTAGVIDCKGVFDKATSEQRKNIQYIDPCVEEDELSAQDLAELGKLTDSETRSIQTEIKQLKKQIAEVDALHKLTPHELTVNRMNILSTGLKVAKCGFILCGSLQTAAAVGVFAHGICWSSMALKGYYAYYERQKAIRDPDTKLEEPNVGDLFFDALTIKNCCIGPLTGAIGNLSKMAFTPAIGLSKTNPVGTVLQNVVSGSKTVGTYLSSMLLGISLEQDVIDPNTQEVSGKLNPKNIWKEKSWTTRITSSGKLVKLMSRVCTAVSFAHFVAVIQLGSYVSGFQSVAFGLGLASSLLGAATRICKLFIVQDALYDKYKKIKDTAPGKTTSDKWTNEVKWKNEAVRLEVAENVCGLFSDTIKVMMACVPSQVVSSSVCLLGINVMNGLSTVGKEAFARVKEKIQDYNKNREEYTKKRAAGKV